MPDDDPIAVLYALPLDRFTAARDALAKEVREAGDRAAAAEVKRLRKPNVAAWALNQLPHRHPEITAELLEVSERLRRAQRKALSGGGADAMREVAAERRRIVARLTRLAETILVESGHAAAPQTLKAISDSLGAVAVDEDGAEAFRRGVLVRELKPGAIVDVGGLKILPGGLAAGPTGEPPGPPDEPTTDDESRRPSGRPAREVEAARRTLALARTALADAYQRAEAAEAEADELDEAAAGHARTAEELVDDVEVAVREAEEAEVLARAARERADELMEDLRAAERRAHAAAEAVASAKREAAKLRAEAEEAARTVAEAEEFLGDA